MLKTSSGLWLLFGWFAMLGMTVAASVAIGARLSTTVLLLVLGASPVVVMWFLSNHAAPPTAAELLYRAKPRTASDD